jgi:hypothetical protein
MRLTLLVALACGLVLSGSLPGAPGGPAALAQMRQPVKNVTVRLNKPEIIHTHWIQQAVTKNPDAACRAIRPPTLVVKRKPKLGTVKIRRGVMIESGANSPCKGRKVRGSTLEYTGTQRGRDSFIIEILFRHPAYYDHKFGEMKFNVSVR